MDHNDPMSFSLYIDKPNHNFNIYPNDDIYEDDIEEEFNIIAETPPDPCPEISKRIREKWVDDCNVPKCTQCKCTFRFYRRRHHCYFCGNIYCDACSNFRNKIPRSIEKIPTRSGKEEPINYNKKVRLCSQCYKKTKHIFNIENVFKVFSLLDLDLYNIKNAGMVCSEWRHASLFYISKFRLIQYKLPYSKYNQWEKDVLWKNRFLLKGHNLWQCHVIRSVKDNPKKLSEVVDLYFSNNNVQFNRNECWKRMCTRDCNISLDSRKALLLTPLIKLNSDSINLLVDVSIQAFNQCNDKILSCYLPYLLHHVVISENTILKDYIFQKCKENIHIANMCYYWFKINCKTYSIDLMDILDSKSHNLIVKGNNLIERIRHDKLEDIKEAVSTCKLVSPIFPELGHQTVDIDGISFKRSATKPVLIPMNKSKLLFKRDDVRKDQTVISVIRLMEEILKENGVDIDIITYNVQPTSEKEGFVEIVDNATTLYQIEKQKMSILNYLMKHNPDVSVDELRKRFLKSCAVYSVIAFLISFSDGHLDNIMLTEKGDLFYIDYGFVLGQGAKPISVPSIRITTGMLEALGGYNSEGYEEFKELCGKIYDILRRHVNTFILLLSVVPSFNSDSWTSPNISHSELHKEIVKKFCPGETYEEAISHLKTKIDKSTNASSLSKYHIIDFFHKHNKEKTVKNVLTSTITTTYSGTKHLINGVYSYLYSSLT